VVHDAWCMWSAGSACCVHRLLQAGLNKGSLQAGNAVRCASRIINRKGTHGTMQGWSACCATRELTHAGDGHSNSRYMQHRRPSPGQHLPSVSGQLEQFIVTPFGPTTATCRGLALRPLDRVYVRSSSVAFSRALSDECCVLQLSFNLLRSHSYNELHCAS
jgi:hypothetical protein